ncbi:MAG: zinc dependent phospholipase C family protein [Fidelibacterota bacterium]
MSLLRLFFRLAFSFSVLLPWQWVWGWGFEGHKLINREAVKLLPGHLGAYFLQEISYLSEHAIDPDLWVGDEEGHPLEGRGHYIDADLYDDYPFRKIPRNWDELLATYGEENVDRWGTAPWRIDRYFHRLIEEFRQGNWEEARLTAAALGHYVSDLHMPLHVVQNYDGQLSGNTGIHRQWEADMVDHFLLEKIHPEGKVVIISDPVEEVFRIVEESYPLHGAILRADSLARGKLSASDRAKIAHKEASMEGTGYLETLVAETGDLARARMEKAAFRVASFWYSAWVEAGRPAPPHRD